MALAKWIGFGAASSSHSNAGPPPDHAKTVVISKAEYKQFGLENFGNTCYANSVLQALYFCHPFRELVVQTPDKTNPIVPVNYSTSPPQPAAPANPRSRNVRKFSTNDVRSPADGSSNGTTSVTGPPIPPSPPTLFSALRALFVHIANNSLDKGTVAPRAFIDKLRKENELFRSSMHQDAHEFLNYLLNKIAEELEDEARNSRSQASSGEDLSHSATSSGPSTLATVHSNHLSMQHSTLVHSLFEGILTSETRCLTCETVSSRDEAFLDLSIDIEQNSSVTACLRQFSASEMLCQRNKFFCDSCCGLQEAEKRMKIKRLPNVLALHLKRFKFQEDVQKNIKLTYRVAFPLELRLFNTVDDAKDPDRLYQLFAINVHIGNGPHHGHYVAIVRSRDSWVVFDDDTVDTIKESEIPKYFGDSNSGCAYVLYYQAVDLDLAALGLKSQDPPTVESAPASPPLENPTLPPGLAPEEDSEAIERSAVTLASLPNENSHPAAPEIPPPLTVVIPPPPDSQPLTPVAIPVIQTTSASPTVKTRGFLNSLRHSPSKGTVGASHRTSVHASPAPPIPPLPTTVASPKLQTDPSDASSSTTPTLSTSNGKVKAVKEKSGGWFPRRRSFRPEKLSDHPLPSRPATAHESTRERHDGASITSSSTSSRAPLNPDTSPSLRAYNPPTETSDSSAMTDAKPHNGSTSTSKSSVLPSKLLSSAFQVQSSPPPSSHQRNNSLHSPTHKMSQPVLKHNTAPRLVHSRSMKRPSTANATISSPSRSTFPSPSDEAPLPPLPSDLKLPKEKSEKKAEADPQSGGAPVHRRNSTHFMQQQPNLKRPPRKLSFTGGMLSFGWRDKDRDKHKDKDTDTPASYSPVNSNGSVSAMPGMSMIGRL